MRLRVAVVADFREEGWPSMDLVADMLIQHLAEEHGGAIDATLVRPPWRRRATLAGERIPGAHAADRILNRLWDYPRLMRASATAFDAFHIVDHSYAQLVHALPAARTIVTCHDLDTFRSVLDAELEPRGYLFRKMTRHILAGLTQAAHVACDSEATRDALVQRAGIDPGRTSVVSNGPHPSCTPTPEPSADVDAARLLGGAGHTQDLLHVGSTVPRKRIEQLLAVLAGVRRRVRGVRLIRAGGAFTAHQRAYARALGIEDAIVVLPFLDRTTLAAVYRHSALVLLPSEREGFGLPVIEALACGTPVIASDIEPLREVGGRAVTYCPPNDVGAWVTAVEQALAERQCDPMRWQARRRAGVERAAEFSWSRYTSDCVALYLRLAGREQASVHG